MDVQEIARQYACALCELGEAKGVLGDLEQEVTVFYDLFQKEENFRIFLESPLLAASKKKSLIRTVFGLKVSQDFLHFLYVLSDKRRYRIFVEIAKEFWALLDKKKKQFRARLTTARALDEDLVQKVGEVLESQSGQKVVLQPRVRPELLGGMVLRLGDIQIDGSLKRRLEHYKKVLMEKKFYEI